MKLASHMKGAHPGCDYLSNEYFCNKCGWTATKAQTVEILFSYLTPEQRLEVMSDYCRGCGNQTPPICHCENDE